MLAVQCDVTVDLACPQAEGSLSLLSPPQPGEALPWHEQSPGSKQYTTTAWGTSITLSVIPQEYSELEKLGCIPRLLELSVISNPVRI